MAQKPIKPAAFPETVSIVELADLAGVSESTIAKLRETGLFGDLEKRGEYPFKKSVKALFLYWREQAAGLPQQKAADQARQAKADADTAELRAGKEAGTLMFRRDAKLLWTAGMIEVRRAVASSKLTAAQKKELSEKLTKIKLEEPPKE